MKFAFHLICWLAMGLSLIAATLLGWLGIAYITEGRGLAPGAAIFGVVCCLACGWAAAHLADMTEQADEQL